MVSSWLFGCVAYSCFGCLYLAGAVGFVVILYGWFGCFCGLSSSGFTVVLVLLCGLVYGVMGLLVLLHSWSWQCFVSVYYLCLVV